MTPNILYVCMCLIQTRGVQTSILGRTPEVPGFTEALHRLNAKLSEESQIDPAALAGAKNVQKVICGRLNTVIFDSLLAGSIRRDRARLRACRMPYAAAWLSVPPIRALGLCFHPREYRACLRLWLGAKQFKHSAKLNVCPACNKSILDDWGIHAVMCANMVTAFLNMIMYATSFCITYAWVPFHRGR